MRRYGRFRDGGSREHDLSMPRKLYHQKTQTSDKHPSSSPVKSSPIKVSSTSPYSLFGVGWNKPLVMLPTSEERKHQTIWTRFGKTRQYTYRSRPYLSSSRCKIVLFRRFLLSFSIFKGTSPLYFRQLGYFTVHAVAIDEDTKSSKGLCTQAGSLVWPRQRIHGNI